MGENMKKKKLRFLSITFVILLFFNGIGRTEQLPMVSATAAAVLDLASGQVLYNKHMHLRRPPASITKILTTIIALEEAAPEELVTVSRRAVYQEGSSIYLAEGEKISLEELLYGIMLSSGNDASVAVAEHIAGTVEKFCDLMNRRAREMGAQNSNFVNPHGLPQADHYSTAYDLAMIMCYAMNNEVFRRITATKYKTISWAGNDWGRGLRNHNKLLWRYSDISGGKTGYTRAAGRCLIASAGRDNREVVAVLLNSSNDWLESRNLLDYGLDHFKQVTLLEKGELIHEIDWAGSREGRLGLITESPITVLVPQGDRTIVKKELYIKSELELPIMKGDLVGSLQISVDDRLLNRTDLIAQNDLNYNSIFLRFWHWMISYFNEQ